VCTASRSPRNNRNPERRAASRRYAGAVRVGEASLRTNSSAQLSRLGPRCRGNHRHACEHPTFVYGAEKLGHPRPQRCSGEEGPNSSSDGQRRASRSTVERHAIENSSRHMHMPTTTIWHDGMERGFDRGQQRRMHQVVTKKGTAVSQAGCPPARPKHRGVIDRDKDGTRTSRHHQGDARLTT